MNTIRQCCCSCCCCCPCRCALARMGWSTNPRWRPWATSATCTGRWARRRRQRAWRSRSCRWGGLLVLNCMLAVPFMLVLSLSLNILQVEDFLGGVVESRSIEAGALCGRVERTGGGGIRKGCWLVRHGRLVERKAGGMGRVMTK